MVLQMCVANQGAPGNMGGDIVVLPQPFETRVVRSHRCHGTPQSVEHEFFKTGLSKHVRVKE